jgi:hypothetical protein
VTPVARRCLTCIRGGPNLHRMESQIAPAFPRCNGLTDLLYQAE